MAGSRRDREVDLGRQVERAIQELRLASDMLRTAAENLTLLNRGARPHLLAAAERLDGAAAALGSELHAGLDPGGVTILARYGRKAVYGIGGILFMLAGGVAEGAGQQAYDSIVRQQDQLTELLTGVERSATALEHEPADTGGLEPSTPAKDIIIIGDDTFAFGVDAAAEILGLTPRQVDYWMRTDLVTQSVHGAGRAFFSQSDLTKMAVVKYLLDDGIKLETIRTIMPKIETAVDDGVTLYLDPQHGAYLDPTDIGALDMPGITRELDLDAVRRELDREIEAFQDRVAGNEE